MSFVIWNFDLLYFAALTSAYCCTCEQELTVADRMFHFGKSSGSLERLCRVDCSVPGKLIGPLGAKQVHATSRPDTLPSLCGEVHSLASLLSSSHTHTHNEKRGEWVREYVMLGDKIQQRMRRRKAYLDLSVRVFPGGANKLNMSSW